MKVWDRAGIEQPGREIDHEIISMVILLPSAYSFKKGCWTGPDPEGLFTGGGGHLKPQA